MDNNPMIGFFTFDEWKDLAKNNPKIFESERRLLIESAINRTEGPRRLRLQQLQFRIDGIRRKYKNNPQYCAQKISDEMYKSLVSLNEAFGLLIL